MRWLNERIRWLTERFGWKVLSVALAFALWLLIVGEPEQSMAIWLPVQYKNIPADLEIGSEIPDRLRMEVRGPARRLTPSAVANSEVSIDLGGVSIPGERTFNVTSLNLDLPAGVQMIRTIPSQIRVKFERRVAKDVPVQIRFSRMPKEELLLKRQEVYPPILRIVGPESRVNLVMFAETDPIDIYDISASSQFQVQAYIGDSQVRLDGPGTVNVQIDVERMPKP